MDLGLVQHANSSKMQGLCIDIRNMKSSLAYFAVPMDQIRQTHCVRLAVAGGWCWFSMREQYYWLVDWQAKRTERVPTEKTNTNLLAFPYHQDCDYCKLCNSPFVFVRWESFGTIVDRIEYLHGRTNAVERLGAPLASTEKQDAEAFSSPLPPFYSWPN